MKSLAALLIIALMYLTARAEDFYTNYSTANTSPVPASAFSLPNLRHLYLPDKEGIEYLPASKFPRGNWGKPVLGYRVSLRLGKKRFKMGEPIIATVLVRNCNNQQSTNQLMIYKSFDSSDLQGLATFKVLDSEGKILRSVHDRAALKDAENGVFLTGSSGSMSLLYPGTQDKYEQLLDSKFPLTNGNYQAFATVGLLSWRITSPDGNVNRNEPMLRTSKPPIAQGEKLQPEVLEVESAAVPFELEK